MEHPRPLLRRNDWQCLDGTWKFAFDDAALWQRPADVRYAATIVVPFAPESQRSTIGDTALHSRLWYSHRVSLQGRQPAAGQRLLLHFGAVDYRATVWVNGQRAGEHVGGHSPFTVDVTEWASADAFELTLLAEDDPLDMHKPRGKQDWQPEPHAIWYPRSSGIWRTVWLERVPATHVSRLRWSADVARWQIAFDARIDGDVRGMTLAVTLSVGGALISSDVIALQQQHVSRSISLPDPGIDDAREAWLWSPEHPQLIDARLELRGPDGTVVDAIDSYTAMRSVEVDDARFLLNGRPYALRMVLDQGYWPDSLMTADSAALRADVEHIKRLGFNGARKHQKSEDPRWLYWADRLGLCVWCEMPSAYAFSDATVHALCDEWRALVERDLSHPCVVAWVPINESWGVPALPTQARQVDLVRALYHMTRALDGTRPVIGNDGWEMPCGDIVAIHDYSARPDVLLQRYGDAAAVQHSLQHERPGGGRKLLVAGFDGSQRPTMLTEFGGIACMPEGDVGWGYSQLRTGAELLDRYGQLLQAVHACKGLAGFCYTQLTDTFFEKNGLLDAQRKPKADARALASATRGVEIDEREYAANPFGYSARWLANTKR